MRFEDFGGRLNLLLSDLGCMQSQHPFAEISSTYLSDILIMCTMVILWLVLLTSTVTANADLSLEQFKLQYKSEEAEHLQQRLEVNTTSVVVVCP